MRADREQLLERIVLGEIGMESEDVQRALDDAEFAERLNGLQETMSLVTQGAVLAEAAELEGSTDVVGEEIAERVVLERGAAPPARVTDRRPLLFAAAAAAAAIAVWAIWPSDPAEPPPDRPLGPGGGPTELTCLAPVGEVEDFAVFRWAVGTEGGSYQVEVFGAEGEDVEGGLSPRLDASTEWRPEGWETWPTDIEWMVRWFDGSGRARESASAQASR